MHAVYSACWSCMQLDACLLADMEDGLAESHNGRCRQGEPFTVGFGAMGILHALACGTSLEHAHCDEQGCVHILVALRVC